jgi:integrase
MAFEIHKAGVRDALKARREPYWGAPIEQGRYVGYRKIDDLTGTWIARMRDEDGKQKYKSLGQLTREFGYTQAKREAEKWFKGRDAGVSDKPPTIADACREYVADLETDGREDTAKDAKRRFKRYIYDEPIGKLPLTKIRTAKLKAWRNGLVGNQATQDRSMRSLKAALNFAVTNRRVTADVAREWRAVKAHKNADKRRDLYLNLKQRRKLIEACEGSVRDLVEAAALTGARPGELVALKRSDFDARTQTINFKGKTGPRSVPLSPAAVKLFKRLAKGKLPKASLLTRDNGEQWKQTTLWSREIRAAAKAAKLPKGVVLYTLRHSFITEALRAGMSTLDVARLTGTSLPMLEAHYGHLAEESVRERLAEVEML